MPVSIGPGCICVPASAVELVFELPELFLGKDLRGRGLPQLIENVAKITNPSPSVKAREICGSLLFASEVIECKVLTKVRVGNLNVQSKKVSYVQAFG